MRLQKKKGVYVLWKKGQVTWGDYKEAAKVRGEEVRKVKAQLELRLATAVKENKKSFYKYISGKRRTKENFHPLLDAAGNVTTEEKAEVPSLHLPLIVRSVILRALYAPIWKSGMVCKIHPR